MRSVDDMDALPVAPSLLGESPLWHPTEAALYWCDIAGRCVNRWRDGVHDAWQVDSEPACCAPLLSGGLLLAMRSRSELSSPAAALVEMIEGTAAFSEAQRFRTPAG